MRWQHGPWYNAAMIDDTPTASRPIVAPVSEPAAPVPVTRIAPSQGWSSLGLRDVWRYRELLAFLVWRDIKVRYKQTALGVAWAIMQPLFSMVIFTVFFGRLANLQAQTGDIPYALFAYTGLVPWSFFAGALAHSSDSLVGSANLIKKVYFPRLIIPFASVAAGLVDVALSFAVLLLLLGGFALAGVAVAPGWAVVLLPLFLLLAMATALGVGMWLSALNVQYRDVRYVVPFLIQIWMFATPIVYPSSLIRNETLRTLYGLNPMTGVVEGFRWALLGTPAPGPLLLVSALAALVLLLTGMLYFRRMERTFADVV